jgi:hypothetical protein
LSIAEVQQSRSAKPCPPRHDFASHGADSFRYHCCAYNELRPPPAPKPKPGPRVDERGVWVLTVDEWLRVCDGGDGIRIRV